MAGRPKTKLCTVLEDDLFRKAASKLQPNPRRLDEMLDGVKRVIAANAEGCHRIPGTQLWFIRTRPFPGGAAVRIVFTIDNDHERTLRNIGLVPPTVDESELDDLTVLLTALGYIAPDDKGEC